MYKIKFFILLSCLIPITTGFGYNLQILEEDSQQFVFTISNETRATLQQEATNGSINITVPDAYYRPAGKYNIPFWSYKLALPNSDKPSIVLSNTQWEDTDFQFSEEESVNTLLNKEPLEIEALGMAGKIPTLFLTVYPIQYDGDTKKLRQLKFARVSIKYRHPFQIQQTEKFDFTYLNSFSRNEHQYQKPLHKITLPSFAMGKWFRIAISDKSAYDFNNGDGFNNIFKITFDQLKEAGLTETSIAKSRIFLYANATFGQKITDYNPAPLIEIPRSFYVKGNSAFSEADFILFYGKSPTGQTVNLINEVDFLRNPYSFNNYFWVLVADSEGNPREIELAEKITTAPDFAVDSTDFLWRKEKENYNILESGNDWYNKIFNGNGSNNVEYFILPSSDQNFPANITLRLKSGSESNTQYFRINLNSNVIENKIYLYEYDHLEKTFHTQLSPRTNTLRIEQYNSSGINYLDYVQATYKIKLSDISSKLLFYAPKESGTIRYNLDVKLTDTPRVFDISGRHHIQELPIEIDGNKLSFTDFNPASDRKTYLLTSESNYSEITSITQIDHPDFTSLYENKDAQYVIITDESFLSAANKIAEIHSAKVKAENQLTTFVTTQNAIMRQFNGDILDAEAIRNFLKYAFENWNIKPEYLLLLGDGTFDHRGIKSETKNHVMTYQVWAPEHNWDYYASDFKFTYLTAGDLIPDLATGRIPVSSPDEVNNYLEKLEDYILDPNFGTWRSTATFVADDPTRPWPDEPEFVKDSETLSTTVFPDIFNLKKIYLTDFPESQDESKYGVKKPAATEAIHSALTEGTVLINYIGHGGPDQWAQEDAFSSEELPNIVNLRKLPLWIAGTCTWGKYDDVLNDCMPEKLVTMKADGGIACIGASRPTVNSNNVLLLQKIFTYWFSNNRINKIRTGDLLKNFVVGSFHNNAKYVLFGDPAMYLALPYETGEFSALENDTLKALQNVQIEGSSSIENFTGKALISLFDSKQSVTRFYNPMNPSEERSISYKLPGDVLFKGNITVENGLFKSSFFVPKDLNYSKDYGKLHIYGWNDEAQTDFVGVYNSILFSGSENIADSTGPKITLLKNNELFSDGGTVQGNDLLALRISDEHGINLTGKMGHTISLEFNENNDLQDLTSAFSYDEGSDTVGTIIIPLPERIEPGEHYIKAKAWDNANNSTAMNFSFSYSKSVSFQLSHLFNYPNPFKNETQFTFFTSEVCDYSITIYTVSGLKIKEFKNQLSEPNGYNQIYWDGTDDFGDPMARGTYVFKILAKSIATGKKDSFIGKMVKN
ncbi:MAG: type IX secretion system sortase PorU [Candidatus Marinimicrobia bacterium]|nr:type IX secretion system sortase PorU [Candidatus Neomarinimicrobiota bacterium]